MSNKYFMLIIPILIAIVYLLSWVYYTKYQLEERNLPDNQEKINIEAAKKWHKCKFINQLAFFSMMFFAVGLFNAIIIGVCYWIVFDAMVAKILLNKTYDYLGRVSFLDTFLKGKISTKVFFYIKCALALGLILVKSFFF